MPKASLWEEIRELVHSLSTIDCGLSTIIHDLMKDACLWLGDEEVVEAEAGVSGEVECYIFQANGYVGVVGQANLHGIEGEVVIPDSESDAEALL